MEQKNKNAPVQLIIGLGNPTEEYQYTYHNVGTLACAYMKDHLPEEWSMGEKHSPKKSFSYHKLHGPKKRELLLIQSLLYMNESGKALHDALSFFKIPLSHVLVLHDDSDMTIGTYKFSYNQRSAGHRGIESIIQHCGSQEFSRGKIGIRPAQEITRKKANEFVLKNILKKDFSIFEKEVFPKIQEALLQ